VHWWVQALSCGAIACAAAPAETWLEQQIFIDRVCQLPAESTWDLAGSATHAVDDHSHCLRGFYDVKCDPDVPAALGGAVTALDTGFQLYGEADALQDVLEFELPVVTAVRGAGDCGNDLASRGQLLPELPVVELVPTGLAGVS